MFFFCYCCLVSSYDEVVYSLWPFLDQFFFFTLLLVSVGSCFFFVVTRSLTLALVYLLAHSFVRTTLNLVSHSLHRRTQNICFRLPFSLRALFLFEFCMFFLVLSHSFCFCLDLLLSIYLPFCALCRVPSLLLAQFQVVLFLLFKLSFFLYTHAFYACWPNSVFFP